MTMEGLTTGIETLASGILSAGIQALVMSLAIFLVERIYRKAPPLLMHWLWFLVILRLALPFNPPLPEQFENMLSRRAATVIDSIRGRSIEMAGISTTGDSAPEKNVESLAKSPENTVEEKPLYLPSRRLISDFWALTTILLALITLLRIGSARRLIRHCSPVYDRELNRLLTSLRIRLGLNRDVSLYTIEDKFLDVPAVSGIQEPIVIVPAGMLKSWKTDELAPILLHELAHIRRNDLVINAFQIAVQIFHAFNPAAWYANMRIRDCREELCDDIAVSTLDRNRKIYSSSILRVMERISGRPALCGLCIAVAGRKSRVVRRIERIMSGEYRIVAKLPLFSSLLLALIIMMGAVLSFAASSLDDKSQMPFSKDIPFSATILHEIDETLFIPHTYPVDTDPLQELQYMISLGETPVSNLQILAIADKDLYIRKTTEVLAQTIGSKTNMAPSIVIAEKFSAKRAEHAPLVIMDAAMLTTTPTNGNELRRYLEKGGFLYADVVNDAISFVLVEKWLLGTLRKILGPYAEIKPIDTDHPLFFSYYSFLDGAPNGSSMHRSQVPLYGAWLDGRLCAVITCRGLLKKWRTSNGQGAQVKFGVNLFVHALFQKDGMLYRHMFSPDSETDTVQSNGHTRRGSTIVIQTPSPIVKGSIRVSLGEKTLYVNRDYIANYDKKEILLLAPEALKPGADITIRYDEATENGKSLDIILFEKSKERAGNGSGKGQTIIPMTARVGFENGQRLYMF